MVRLFADLIMADTVIDAGEIEYFDVLREEYRFTADDELAARDMSLQHAIEELRGCDKRLLSDVKEHCSRMSVSDGYMAVSEALLIYGALSALNSDEEEACSIVSVPAGQHMVPKSCIVYIESDACPAIHTEIENNYKGVYARLRVAGFEFVYVPHIATHYRNSDKRLVEGIVRFISPSLSAQGVDTAICGLINMTSTEFTRDILCNKLGLEPLRTAGPSLLLSIGTSFVGDEVYTNYLRIGITDTFMQSIDKLIDEITSMLCGEVTVVSRHHELRNQFLYSGFYKMLLDAHLLRRNVRCHMCIDVDKEEIYLPEADIKLQDLSRRERALYLLLLARGEGGVSFAKPKSKAEIEVCNKRMSRLQNDYAKIYRQMGGSTVPDLRESTIRTPMFSRIKRELAKYEDQVYNLEDFKVRKDDDKFYIDVNNTLVLVRSFGMAEGMPLAQWIDNYL